MKSCGGSGLRWETNRNKGKAMILARKKDDGSYEVVDGIMRMKVALELRGTVEVVDMETHETLTVHDIDGRLVVLSEAGQRGLEETTGAIIDSMRRPKP